RVVAGARFGTDHTCGRVLQALRSQRDHQIAKGLLVVADELTHHGQPSVDRDLSRRRRGLTGDQAQQRALAYAVGTDQCDPVAVADGEIDVAQQLGAARTSPSHMADLDRPHRGRHAIRLVPPSPPGYSQIVAGIVAEALGYTVK